MNSNVLKIAGLAALLLVVTSVSIFSMANGSSEGLSKDDVTKIVSEYIANNPQAILDSVAGHQQKEAQERSRNAQQQITQKRAEIEDHSTAPFAGNANGDVTIVEFFDYACGYCKRALPDLIKILEEDSGVKVVFKEFPILGPNSVLAAKAALAVHASEPEKYLPFHTALMKTRINGTEGIMKIAKESGVNVEKMSALLDSSEIQKIIEDNYTLGSGVGINGTPAFIINGKFYGGAISYDEFKKSIEEARKG